MDVSSFFLNQFRNIRNVYIPENIVSTIYSDPKYSSYVIEREKKNFPSLIKLPKLLQSHCTPHSVQQTGVAPSNPQTGVAPLNPRTGVAPLNPQTGVAPLNPQTGVASLKPQSLQKNKQSLHGSADGKASQQNWLEKTKPVFFQQIYGQSTAIDRCSQWKDGNEWLHKFLIIIGPTGCGKSSITNILLPGALELDFITYSNEILHAALLKSSVISSNGVASPCEAPYSAVIIKDYPCLCEKKQDHIRNLLGYFSSKTKHYPIPVVLLFDTLSPSFATFSKDISEKVHVNQLSEKTLTALGFKTLDNLRILTGDVNKSNRFTIIKKSIEVSLNARHFIICLQQLALCGPRSIHITSHSRSTPQNPTLLDFDCSNYSEFELVRKFWAILRKNKPDISKSSRDKLYNNFAQIPNLFAWITFNTSTVITDFENLVSFLEIGSALDLISSRTFYEPLLEENVNTAAILSCAVYPDWRDGKNTPGTVQYPPFLRKPVPQYQKVTQSAVQLQLNKIW
jgi:hypothetical protein